MDENIYVQVYVFLFTLYGGLIIGILYDIIDILLYGQRKRSKGRGKTDILFWMLAIIIVLSILFYSNDGIIRAYTLIGFAVGWLLYFWLLSRFIQKIIYFIQKWIINIIKLILYIAIMPYKWIKAILYRPFMKLYNKGIHAKDQVLNYFNIPRLILNQFNKYKKYIKKIQK